MRRACCCGKPDQSFTLERSLLCRTNQMRRVDLVEIRTGGGSRHPLVHLGSGAKPARSKRIGAGGSKSAAAARSSKGRQERPVVAVTGRVHPGETPASFVIQGLLDFCTSDHEDAKHLRQCADIVVVPMLNPDGVFLGNYRSG